MSLEKLRDCASRGLTQSETARELGVSSGYVSKAASTHRIPFTRKRGGPLSKYEQAALLSKAEEASNAVVFSKSPPIKTKPPIGRGERESKARRMHEAGHPPGVIAMYCGMPAGDVRKLLGLELGLTAEQAADLRTYKSSGYSEDEALREMGLLS